jgi:hypothetical protein
LSLKGAFRKEERKNNLKIPTLIEHTNGRSSAPSSRNIPKDESSNFSLCMNQRSTSSSGVIGGRKGELLALKFLILIL